jgi:hypothetical protein
MAAGQGRKIKERVQLKSCYGGRTKKIKTKGLG